MDTFGGLIALILAALVIVVIVIRNIRIVQQARAYVIEYLGAYKTTWNVGLHFKIPFLEKVAKVVSLKEQVADFPPQPQTRSRQAREPRPQSPRARPWRSARRRSC